MRGECCLFLKRSLIWIWQYPEFLSSVEKTVASPKLSIHLFKKRMGHASRMVAANHSVVDTKGMCAVFSGDKNDWCCTLGYCQSYHLLSNHTVYFSRGNCLEDSPACYTATWIGPSSSPVKSMLFLATFIRSRNPFHMLLKLLSIHGTAGRCFPNIAGSWVSFLRSFFRAFSSSSVMAYLAVFSTRSEAGVLCTPFTELSVIIALPLYRYE